MSSLVLSPLSALPPPPRRKFTATPMSLRSTLLSFGQENVGVATGDNPGDSLTFVRGLTNWDSDDGDISHGSGGAVSPFGDASSQIQELRLTNFLNCSPAQDHSSSPAVQASLEAVSSSSPVRLELETKHSTYAETVALGSSIPLDPAPKNPVPVKLHHDSCFRCGERGHHAKVCRNARVCFRCRQTGHVAKSCPRRRLKTQSGSIYLGSDRSSSNLASKSFPSCSQPLPPLTPIFSPPPQSAISPLMALPTLRETPATAKLTMERSRSVFFRTDGSIGPSEVIAALSFGTPPGMLSVHFLGNNWFQAVGPEAWKKSIMANKKIWIGNRPFDAIEFMDDLVRPVHPLRLWVRVVGVPYG